MEEKAKEYCKKIDESQGEAWSNDYEVLPMYMADFARKVNESLTKENEELKGLIERLIKGGSIKSDKKAVVKRKLSKILTPKT